MRLLRVTEVESFLAAATGRAARKPIRLLALDGVTNSQNVGMVVRSVVGAGLDGLLWPTVGQPWVNGLVVRAAGSGGSSVASGSHGIGSALPPRMRKRRTFHSG